MKTYIMWDHSLDTISKRRGREVARIAEPYVINAFIEASKRGLPGQCTFTFQEASIMAMDRTSMERCKTIDRTYKDFPSADVYMQFIPPEFCHKIKGVTNLELVGPDDAWLSITKWSNLQSAGDGLEYAIEGHSFEVCRPANDTCAKSVVE